MMDVSKEGVKFNAEEINKKSKENEDFINFLKETLGERVESVKVSDRLTDIPCILVATEYGWNANMERIIKSQALRNNEMDQYMGSKRILEINLGHKVIKSLRDKYSIDSLKNKYVDVTLLMFDTALINSGFMLDKPSEYANKINRLIELGICDDDGDDDLEDLDDDDMETNGLNLFYLNILNKIEKNLLMLEIGDNMI